MTELSKKSVAVIVAHPDDETLWAGETILNHPLWQWFIVCPCRGSDHERVSRFYNALEVLDSDGKLANMECFALPVCGQMC